MKQFQCLQNVCAKKVPTNRLTFSLFRVSSAPVPSRFPMASAASFATASIASLASRRRCARIRAPSVTRAMASMMNSNNGGSTGASFGPLAGAPLAGASPGPGPGVRAPPTRSSERAASGTGAFVDYGVYKTKGALKLKAVRATFESDASGRRIMKRAGGVLLELANATAPRQYDWGNKGSFMLSATEAAELADRMASNAPCSFFHDPGAGGANRGNVNKAFKVEPMPDGSGGLFVNLQTTSGGNKSFVSVPVSYGESAALRHILVYLVPKIAGFDEVFRE